MPLSLYFTSDDSLITDTVFLILLHDIKGQNPYELIVKILKKMRFPALDMDKKPLIILQTGSKNFTHSLFYFINKVLANIVLRTAAHDHGI